MADPTDEVTVVEALTAMRRAGFGGDFSAVVEGVRCAACGATHRAEELTVDETVRVEGLSDPEDEAVVFGLTCRDCGSRGVLVTAYGPSASPEEAAVITALHDRP